MPSKTKTGYVHKLKYRFTYREVIMYILLFVIGVILLIGAVLIFRHFDDGEDAGFWVGLLGIVVITVSIIGICTNSSVIAKGRYLDEMIEMYESENARIEQKVSNSINAYLEHESKTFERTNDFLENGSVITVVAAYPELSSSELISEQIAIYNENAAKIKELRVEQIEIPFAKWKLYFGG